MLHKSVLQHSLSVWPNDCVSLRNSCYFRRFRNSGRLHRLLKKAQLSALSSFYFAYLNCLKQYKGRIEKRTWWTKILYILFYMFLSYCVAFLWMKALKNKENWIMFMKTIILSIIRKWENLNRLSKQCGIVCDISKLYSFYSNI